MNSTTEKMNLFGDIEEKKEVNKLDDFMNRYNNHKRGIQSNFNTSDFDILLNELDLLYNSSNKLKLELQETNRSNFILENELNQIQDNKNVICQLNNENNKLKSELEQLKNKAFIPKKKMQQITKQQIHEIKSLRNDGLSYSEIECKTKWSKFTISRVLNGHYDTK